MLKAKVNDEKVDTLLAKSQIPIIDLAHCGTEECPIPSVVSRVAAQLQRALSEKSFAFIVNHGISEEKLKTAWKYLDDFYDLPMDIKKDYVDNWSENIETKKGSERDINFVINIHTLEEINLPDHLVPGFSDHISELAKEFKSIACFLLRALALSIDLPPSFFLEEHSEMLIGNQKNQTSLRLFYYPPIVEDDNTCELVKGSCTYSYQRCLSEGHQFDLYTRSTKDDEENKASETEVDKNGYSINSETVTFTLIAQDSEGGLEVKLPGSEKWQRVGYLPGAILINSGELLSKWTNGRFPAIKRRVTIPKDEHLKARRRHSIEFLCRPDNATIITPTDLQIEISNNECDKKNPRRKPFTAAKNKVYNAYQLIQKRFKETYGS